MKQLPLLLCVGLIVSGAARADEMKQADHMQMDHSSMDMGDQPANTPSS